MKCKVTVDLDMDVEYETELTQQEIDTINKFYEETFNHMLENGIGCGNITIKIVE
jgi:hypothetical protein